jgi:crossover junction endodeoxyribonuclease RuvC
MIISFDPGQTGAIAALHDGLIVALHDMPIMARAHGKGQQVDPYALATMILEISAIASGDVESVIEQVGAMPGQGSVSMFNFGEGVGVVKGVLGALQIPVRFVRPQYWKGKAGLKNAEKDAARTLAIQLHPEVADMLTRKKDVGRADAICIAHFG